MGRKNNEDGWMGDIFGEIEQEQVAGEDTKKKRNKRRRTSAYEMDDKFLMRRAFGEDNLLEVMGIEKLRKGQTFHIMTGGNVDQLSFLKVVMLHCPILDYLMVSTWVTSYNDILWIENALKKGKIKNIDLYFGEIFPNQYRQEWIKVKEMFHSFQQIGRVAYFSNHAKILAGWGGDFYFTIECSANLNMNPRNEQGIITIDKGLAEFYKEYYDKINDFGKGEDELIREKIN